MTSPGPNARDDQILVQYLLGLLPEADAERLDELSVTDDDFAMRLIAVENDVVDAYARGELSGEILERFRTFYLATAKRREKVRFAESLLSIASQTSSVSAQVAAAPMERKSREGLARRSSWLGFLTIPGLGFAAPATMLVVASLLVVDDVRVHNQVNQAHAARIALQQRERDLQAKIDEQHAVNAEMGNQLAQVRESLAQLETMPSGAPVRPANALPVSIASFVLSPQMRGVGQPATLAVPRGTTSISLGLELEADDFAQYGATLKAPASGQVLWRSWALKPNGRAQNRIVSIRVPANVLKQQNYTLELSGIPSNGGDAVFVSSYVFRVVSN